MRTVTVGDISMRVAEQGEGPLVLLLHGFPESWYSYRHQLPALAAAGYTAVAPDMRGYGSTDAPEPIEDYALDRQCADITGLMDLYGEERAVVVGHDWGALLVWQCTALVPQRVRAVVAGTPKRVNRPKAADTKTPALPKAEAISTSSLIRSEVIARTKATAVRATTLRRAAMSLPRMPSVGMRRTTMLCETCAPEACRAECTTDRIAEIKAPPKIT